MRYTKKLFVLFFAAFLFIGTAVITADAQSRGVRVYRRPIVVRPYYGFYNSWYWNSWNNPYFGDPFFSDPYLNARRQKYYLHQNLRGKRRSLAKRIEKYNEDGVLTAKEREKLDDKSRGVAKAERKLREFNDDYAE